jgi:glycosyltransferase involved in cell wall biosynthesis
VCGENQRFAESLKIAIVTESFLPKIDGIVTMLTKTVECLRRNGDEVLIFAPSGGPAELFGAEVVGMPSMACPLYPELRLALPRTSMREKLEQFQPDVLHLFEPVLLGVGGIYYSAELHVPLVISYHTNLPAYLGYYGLRAIEKLTWTLMRVRHRRANLNLCTSHAMLTDLDLHGIDHLAMWERAVDAVRFHPGMASESMRQRLSGGNAEAPLLLYVGRLSAEKDVAALKQLFATIPGMRLAIVGDGPLRGELEKQLAGTATVFTGYLRGEELASAYASADLFVLPSRTETLGLVLLEAMASGCPVVACRAGGVPDAVEHGVTGFLFDPEQPGAMAATVEEAWSQPELRDEIRYSARKDTEQHSWMQATSDLRQLYCQVIHDKAKYGRRVREREEIPLPRRLAAGIARGTLRTLLP